MDKLIFLFVIVIIGVAGVLLFTNKPGQTQQILSTQTAMQKITTTPIPPNEIFSSPTGVATSTPVNVNKEITTTIKTSKGDIVLTLYSKEAPKTVQNFVSKAQSGYYNNLTFHRVEDWVIQGGDPLGNGTGGGKMPTELNDKPFMAGSLGVARGQDINISNDSQFFITKMDANWLNKQYTNFGIVTKGMDVVKNIQIGDKILGITVE